MLLLSVCDGIGAIWVATEDLPLDIFGAASEIAADAIAIVAKRFPHVANIGRIEEITEEMLVSLLDQPMLLFHR